MEIETMLGTPSFFAYVAQIANPEPSGRARQYGGITNAWKQGTAVIKNSRAAGCAGVVLLICVVWCVSAPVGPGSDGTPGVW